MFCVKSDTIQLLTGIFGHIIQASINSIGIVHLMFSVWGYWCSRWHVRCFSHLCLVRVCDIRPHVSRRLWLLTKIWIIFIHRQVYHRRIAHMQWLRWNSTVRCLIQRWHCDIFNEYRQPVLISSQRIILFDTTIYSAELPHNSSLHRPRAHLLEFSSKDIHNALNGWPMPEPPLVQFSLQPKPPVTRFDPEYHTRGQFGV